MIMVLVHSLYQLIQTNLTWAAQCWTILGQTNVLKWISAQDINTDCFMTSHEWWLQAVLHWWLCTCTADRGLASSGACETVNQSQEFFETSLWLYRMLTYVCASLWFWLQWGGHMISIKQHQKRKLETTKNTSCTDCILTTHPPNLITTSNRFQQSIGWTANFRIKPLLISNSKLNPVFQHFRQNTNHSQSNAFC